jgi:putative membrane protein
MGFKNNQAYDRLWEARKLWGGITNASRNFATLLLALVEDKSITQEILYRHIAYINILRLQLRKTISWATSEQNLHQTFVSERDELEAFDKGLQTILEQNNKMQYYEQLHNANNAANIILREQINHLTKLKKNKQLDDFEHSDLVKQMNELMNLQGGCERIKSTPLYRQFSIFSRVFVKLFITLIPFALLNETNKLNDYGVWLTIPFTILISWVFYTMEQIGEFSENPFDNSINDVPMTAICRNIEIDIKELLGETNLPPKIQPVENAIM